MEREVAGLWKLAIEPESRWLVHRCPLHSIDIHIHQNVISIDGFMLF